ncbi:MAG: alcohol dehydrogenase [Gammaproteobacteria bacterium]|nr:MAG: alcohol dehydrogenase [Gammaproteobacteria bacterium]
MSHVWQNILVSPTSSIKEVLRVIDREALRLALVVDEAHNLVGTVSDGDVRRALIDGKEIAAPVSSIMCINPTTVDVRGARSDVLRLMREKELFSIPILNNGRVVGLETLHQALVKPKYDNPVFLMAGGFGKRLRPLTDNCPKPLLKVGDKPILEIVISNFIRSGFRNFYISTHYMPELIMNYFGNGEKWGVSIKYVHEDNPLGTGGALGLLPKNLPDLPVLVMNGDVLTKVNLENVLSFHENNDACVTMCVREHEYQVPYGVIEAKGNKILGMTEKPTHIFHVNAGIYVIGRDIIKSVQHNECVDLPSLLERHLDKNILIYPFHEYWLDIGRMDDFNRAQTDIHTLGLL